MDTDRSRPIRHVPEHVRVTADVEVVTAGGQAVRLLASEPWSDGITASLLVAATAPDVGLGPARPGELQMPRDARVWSYLRVGWTSPELVQRACGTLGGYADVVMGRGWMRTAQQLLLQHADTSWLAGTPAGIARAVRDDVERVWRRLWDDMLRRDVAVVQFVHTLPERRGQGLARLLYPAMADLLDRRGVPLLQSTNLTQGEQGGESFWAGQPVPVAPYTLPGEARRRVVAAPQAWRPVPGSDRPPDAPGRPLRALLRRPAAPELPAWVTLDASPGELLAALTPERLLVPLSRRVRVEGRRTL